MNTLTFRSFMPRFLRNLLWGNRERWGLKINPADVDWEKYQEVLGLFYSATQRSGIGSIVNDAGYQVISGVNLADKVILEIGAGDIKHFQYWVGRPKKYILADISNEMMDRAKNCLDQHGVPYDALMLERGESLPLDDQSVDLIFSFYSLEHLYPLTPYLMEMLRVLKPGGLIIGAIPAEGGVPWGIGRALTSRRWFKKNTTIDPDKIICWEHPNFADEILNVLDGLMDRKCVSFWPLPLIPLVDANLIIRFQYRRI